MKDSVYVIFTKNGIERTLKTDGFTLKSGERAIRIDLHVPDEAFKPVRYPVVTVSVPAECLDTLIETTVELEAIG